MKHIAILLITIVLAFYSCNKKTETDVCGTKQFIFVDKNGNDIFNKNTDNHLSINDIEIYTPENRKLNVIHLIFENKNNFIIELNNGTTYIKLGNITIDTVFATYKEEGNSLFISELYYNNILLEKNKHLSECDKNNPKIIVE